LASGTKRKKTNATCQTTFDQPHRQTYQRVGPAVIACFLTSQTLTTRAEHSAPVGKNTLQVANTAMLGNRKKMTANADKQILTANADK
jgi:hypothetical protein